MSKTEYEKLDENENCGTKINIPFFMGKKAEWGSIYINLFHHSNKLSNCYVFQHPTLTLSNVLELIHKQITPKKM